MNQKNSEEIVAIAPYLFRYDGWDDITKTLMRFGFECGDGWVELLKKLTTELKEIDVQKQIKVFQVKEKFGSLRFYVEYDKENILEPWLYKKANDIISKYESMSETTCEVCGKVGKIKSINHWLRCRCPECLTETRVER